jgi:hypothetical protein
MRSVLGAEVFINDVGGTARLRVLGLIVLMLACCWPASATSAGWTSVRIVRYRGISIRVPRPWPIIDLSRAPHACVRFDRHAVYLGTPGAEERCPARAVGRTEALLIEPLGDHSPAGLLPRQNASEYAIRSAAVRVTATWARSPEVVAQALGRKSLPGPANPSIPVQGGPASSHHAKRRGQVFTGYGFDRCAAPSRTDMSAWKASPYRAVGIYIGGVNSACLQHNLTSSWVSSEIHSGWHPVPLYVGLQAPQNGCGCQAMSTKSTTAKRQGRAAAADAVTQAQSLGIPAGNAIYDDMEGYSTTTRNSRAVLAFLSGWTTKLHAEGYLSGVYSSANSGIHDLVKKYKSQYHEPDDIWIADWNGTPNTQDPQVPSGDWPDHQRLHQYRGDSTETYDKVTLNVDDNYLNGQTASGRDGYTLLTSNGGIHAFGSAISHGSDRGKLGVGVSAISLATDPTSGGYWILKSNGGVDSFDAPPHGSLRKTLGSLVPVAIAAPPEGGYLILTSDGGVRTFGGAKWYGSDAGKLPSGVSAVALAVDPKTHGYWLLKSNGGVDNFHSPWKGSMKHKLGSSVPVSIAAPPGAGYLILSSNGGVHKFGKAASYGSDAGKLPTGVTAVALATSPRLAGYRILRSDGGIDSFDATWSGSLLDVLPSGASAAALVSGG